MTDLIVSCEEGKLRGKTSLDYHGGSFYAFCGIPYAKAPVGELRFRAPQPPEPWEGVRDATKEGYECPSLDMYFGYNIGHEDNCLNLNIYTKEIPMSESFRKKPVMVWIHGGGFMYGSNKADHFGPYYLMTEDIVLVAINYRLGIFGFLSLEDPSLNVPGNAALKDQVMALKWIKKNVHNFGGDPNNITIFGESAGSACVHYLTISPQTKGLFQKAIMQSGSCLNVWARGKPNAAEVAKCLGYKETDEKTVLHRLMKESARTIVNSQFKIKDGFFASQIRPLGPVIERPSPDAFLCEDPIEIIKSGRHHQIPVIMGYNSREGIFYELIRRTRNYANLQKTLELDVPYDCDIPENDHEGRKRVAEQLKQYYYDDDDICEENVKTRYLLTGDIQFVYGIQKAIQLQTKYGNQPIYVYRNSLDGPLNFFKKFCQVKYFKTAIMINFFAKMSGSNAVKSIFQNLRNKLPSNTIDGVAHADDIFYLFTTFFTPKIALGSEEDLLIQKFVKTWTNFARYGNPTPEADEIQNKVIWKPIESPEIDTIFDIDRHARLTDNMELDRMKLWDSMYSKYTI
ncbi:unnamed protein product [Acanthoscelides obtectus]|uniref:Carboxylic ester hydrolase n=2 Tax=Acanthoscelides obtectus TaxID=200917 RepID=A0A9P0JI20_ACAOB|nr:unnamed protein product [Acanthoscelides obtectus]CAK1657993.1 Esterase B1 [Acanthoscelides obtectus]